MGKFTNELLEAALQYAERGWRVIPLNEKRPRFENWPDEATIDPEAIRRWWRKWPNASIGILAGEDHLIVIDSDCKNGRDGEAALAALELKLGELPDTYEVATPHGRHRYFIHPQVRIPNSVSKIGSGLDIRSNRGYVVAPPSIVDGRRYALLSDRPLAELPALWVSHLAAASASSSIVIQEGSRNSSVFAEAIRLRGRNVPFDEAIEQLREFNSRHCPKPLTDKETTACLTSAYKYRTGYEQSDLGNAQRLLDAAEEKIMYVPAIGSFFLFDGVCWVEDPHGLATIRLLKESNRRILSEAAGIADESARKKLLKFATQSQNTSKLKSSIENAQSEPGVEVRLVDLNSDPMLLGVRNGVIDLRNGQFRAAQLNDRITKLCGCRFVEDAECPLWKKFLEQAFKGDSSLIAYAQRMVGYTLTGDTREQLFFALLGPGGSGKSTFLEVVASMLGDYAANIRTDSLMAGLRPAGSASEDLARLVGVRFLTTTETTEGSRFNQALIKDLTGGDRVTARFLYKGSFEFFPQFKLLIQGNHRPKFDGEDSGMARRLRLLPFEHSVSLALRDTGLVAKLRQELPGILIWAIEGCLQWQSLGLGESDAVLRATANYLLEMDPLGQCLEERFQQVDEYAVPVSRLYDIYKQWCHENGYPPKSKTIIGQSLTARGFTSTRRRVNGLVTVVRIGLRQRPRRLINTANGKRP